MSTPVGQNHTFLTSITSVTQIVNPASNTRGLELRTAIIGGTNGGISVYTGPTAPTAHGDTGPPLIFSSGTISSEVTRYLPYPLSMPAGYGLWVTASSGSTNAIALTWDLLA